jgi:hypothetical protein
MQQRRQQSRPAFPVTTDECLGGRDSIHCARRAPSLKGRELALRYSSGSVVKNSG